jgi:sentrin-specific protease 1
MLANLEDRTPSLRGYNYQRVRNWGRRNAPEADIFRLETLFIPININNCHWASAVIDFQAHTITFLDSLGDPGMPHLNRLLRYLQDEYRALYDQELAGWTLVPTPSSTPRQVNGFDCGVYTCLFANRTFQRATLHATPHDISTFREHIAYSIVSGAARLGWSAFHANWGCKKKKTTICVTHTKTLTRPTPEFLSSPYNNGM